MSDEPFDIGAALRDAERKLTEYRIIEQTATTLLRRAHSGGPISMNSPDGDQITVSTTWLVAALADARTEGFREGRSIVQPLCNWANEHPKGWRDAVSEETVTDSMLRDVLDTILEWT